MSRSDSPIDERLLAAYLANTLPTQWRAAVTAQLAQCTDARTCLVMAYKALEASGELRRFQTRKADLVLRKSTPFADRPSVRSIG